MLLSVPPFALFPVCSDLSYKCIFLYFSNLTLYQCALYTLVLKKCKRIGYYLSGSVSDFFANSDIRIRIICGFTNADTDINYMDTDTINYCIHNFSDFGYLLTLRKTAC